MRPIPQLRSDFCNSINQWISYLDVYTIQQLRQRPATGHWSLGQVYQHLIEDTSFYVEQMEASMATDQHINDVMTSEAMALFTANNFPDKQLENPFNDINLPQPDSREMLRKQLITIREKVYQLFKDPVLKKGKTLHPGFQYFNAAEWLQFADMHLRHHLGQKKRIDEIILNA